MTYALGVHHEKKDESYEFDDKSIFTLTFDDVQKVIHVNYMTEDPRFKTSSS